jgi:L-2-hydroxyglutarate oxidase LhgO
MSHRPYDVVVIGAGLIGLATAMKLLERFPRFRVGVLEKEDRPATQQSGHNSGVIHSGIYYKPGSFKAQFCVAGRASMVEFCERHGVPYQRCGKVIVATREEELPRLESLWERGAANRVPGLEMITPARLREIEPHVKALAALWAPSTGIVHFPDVANVYRREVESRGGEIHFGAALEGAAESNGLTTLETGAGSWDARWVINCAGLHSDRVARTMGVATDVRIIPFRGEYYSLRKDREHLVRGLIYPVPDPRFPFLGVHFTRTTRGSTEAGPNAVLATHREGYRKRDFSLGDLAETLSWPGFWRMAQRDWRTGLMEVHRSFQKSVFVRDLQRLIPDVRSEDLVPGGSGVRAQAVDATGKLLDDFRIERTARSVHVLNAPSPGATSSLVIGCHIVDLAARAFAWE